MRWARRILALGAAGAMLGGAVYGLTTWYQYGRPSRVLGEDSLLDDYMPEFEVLERHEVQVEASAATTFAAAKALELRRSRLITGIFRARELMMGAKRPDNAAMSRPFLEEMLGLGWRVLAEVADREIVLGAATRPWHAEVVFRGLKPAEFAEFTEPEYVKIAVSLSVEPLEGGRSIFRTETRVKATDGSSRRRFRRYWVFVSAGIRLIRVETLRLVKQEAESREAKGV